MQMSMLSFGAVITMASLGKNSSC